MKEKMTVTLIFGYSRWVLGNDIQPLFERDACGRVLYQAEVTCAWSESSAFFLRGSGLRLPQPIVVGLLLPLL